MEYFWKNTKIGFLTVVQKDGYIVKIDFGKIKLDGEFKLTSLIEKTFLQLEEYFCAKRKTFDIPYKTQGTDFQEKIWNELKKIPYGTTKSYSQIAQLSGNKKAARAAGSANNKNPILFIIPCHRVISSSGDIGGYKGGIKIKETLLKIEKDNR